MKKLIINEPDRIAKDYMIGNTKVRIATNYCDGKTPDEVQEILHRVSRMAAGAFVAQAAREGKLPAREYVKEDDFLGATSDQA